LLPKDGNSAEESLLLDIANSKKNINIAMFMVTNKKLTNALKQRAKKGKIDIKLIADESYDKAHKKITKVKKLSSVKNISLFSAKGLRKKKNKFGIMHAKLVIIDDKIVYVGSTNWTKSAFHSNYEILIKITDATTAKLYNYYFFDILEESKKYN
jgi:phosphatidylserine/phosphatidylglycerophosphate/cardiolipin synthase-like enzyme